MYAAMSAAAAAAPIELAKVAVPGKWKFPGRKVGEQETDKEDPSKALEATSTSSMSCNPSKTPDIDMVECIDDDCKGEDKKCTVGEEKGCPCIEWTLDAIMDSFETEFGDTQARILGEALGSLPDSAPPSCFVNINGKNFAGEPESEPESWCVCSSGTASGIYPTIASKTGSDACSLDKMSDKTISISHKPKPTGPITSYKHTTQVFDPLFRS